MAAKKPSEDELVRWLVDGLDDALLADDYPIAEVERELRQQGADPKAVGDWGEALVVDLARTRRHAWQVDAARTRDAMKAKLARRATVAAMPRADLLRRNDEAKRNPRFAGQLSLAARVLDERGASDEALREILEDLEALTLIVEGDPQE